MDFQVLSSGSKGNAYILDDNNTKLLIEAGIPWKQLQKKMNFKTHELSACICSHLHTDHSGYIKDVLDAGIDTYVSESIIEHYGLEKNHHRIHKIKHKKVFKQGTWAILPLSVPHDKDVPNLAFLFVSGKDKWLFAIDCLYFPYLIPNLTGIALGINYDMAMLKDNVKNDTIHPALANRILSSHMSLQVALDFFTDQNLSKVREIHIIHTSEVNADKDQIKEAIQRQTGKLVLMA